MCPPAVTMDTKPDVAAQKQAQERQLCTKAPVQHRTEQMHQSLCPSEFIRSLSHTLKKEPSRLQDISHVGARSAWTYKYHDGNRRGRSLRRSGSPDGSCSGSLRLTPAQQCENWTVLEVWCRPADVSRIWLVHCFVQSSVCAVTCVHSPLFTPLSC